jgi:hypothetical protein
VQLTGGMLLGRVPPSAGTHGGWWPVRWERRGRPTSRRPRERLFVTLAGMHLLFL